MSVKLRLLKGEVIEDSEKREMPSDLEVERLLIGFLSALLEETGK